MGPRFGDRFDLESLFEGVRELFNIELAFVNNLALRVKSESDGYVRLVNQPSLLAQLCLLLCFRFLGFLGFSNFAPLLLLLGNNDTKVIEVSIFEVLVIFNLMLV